MTFTTTCDFPEILVNVFRIKVIEKAVTLLNFDLVLIVGSLQLRFSFSFGISDSGQSRRGSRVRIPPPALHISVL